MTPAATPVGSRAVLPPVGAGDEEGPCLYLPQDSVHPYLCQALGVSEQIRVK